MIRLLATFLATCWFATISHAFQTESSSEIQAESSGFLLHIDVDQLNETRSGQTLILSAFTTPFVAEQMATLPEELAFLTKTTVHSITSYSPGSHNEDSPVVRIRAEIDEERLVNLLENGRQYARVQYRSTDIHHWVTNLDQLAQQFMGSSNDEKEERFEPVYVSIPRKGTIVVSTSLGSLTSAIDQAIDDQSLIETDSITQLFGEGKNLVIFSQFGGTDFPGDISAVVREGESGEVVVQTAIRCHNDQHRQTASLVNRILNQPELAAQMLGQTANQNMETFDVSRSDNGDSGKQNKNSLSFGLSFDSGEMKSQETSEIIQRILSKCVESKLHEDMLTINASFFLGPWKVQNTHLSSDEAADSGQPENSLVIMLNAFSSADSRDKAVRTAQESDGNSDGLRRR